MSYPSLYVLDITSYIIITIIITAIIIYIYIYRYIIYMHKSVYLCMYIYIYICICMSKPQGSITPGWLQNIASGSSKASKLYVHLALAG